MEDLDTEPPSKSTEPKGEEEEEEDGGVSNSFIGIVENGPYGRYTAKT